ncbi:hypothetical protein P3T73_12495 [Kiritimatiellota bacterium B12222]|nr:hypothetical protein P3T73_12495 [Kiritimatiellota bacterium B12222]
MNFLSRPPPLSRRIGPADPAGERGIPFPESGVLRAPGQAQHLPKKTPIAGV